MHYQLLNTIQKNNTKPFSIMLKKNILSLFLLALVGFQSAKAQTCSLTGIVERGVEACDVIRLPDSTYLEVVGGFNPSLAVGTAIRFDTTQSSNQISFCMQGTMVNLTCLTLENVILPVIPCNLTGTVVIDGLDGCGTNILLPNGSYLEVVNESSFSLQHGDNIRFDTAGVGDLMSMCQRGTMVNLTCLTVENPNPVCNLTGTVVIDGLDGCGTNILLPNGSYLEVVGGVNIPLQHGDNITFDTTQVGDMMSICMRGTMVNLTCLTRAENSNPVCNLTGRVILDDVCNAGVNIALPGENYIKVVSGLGALAGTLHNGDIIKFDTTQVNNIVSTCGGGPIQMVNLTCVTLVETPTFNCYPTEVSIFTPFLRRCDTATYYVNYSNYNDNSVTGAYVDVQIGDNLTFVSSENSYTNLGNGLIRFDIGTVPAYSNNSVNLLVYVNCDNTALGDIHCIEATIFPHATCQPLVGDTIITILPIDSNITDSIYFEVNSNFGLSSNVNLTGRLYEDHLIIRIMPILRDGNTTQIIAVYRNPNKTYRLETQQISTLLGVDQQPSATIYTDNTSNISNSVLQLSQAAEPWRTTYCAPNVDSFDPNSKEAFPIGYGTQHNIAANVDLEYVIHFQNEGTANANKVVVEDVIDTDLDINTLIAGAATHAYTVERNGNTVKFIFDNIQLVPKSTNEEASMGAIKYSIRQKANNAIGTTINNTANIYFDFNTAIITNTTQHIVGEPAVYSQFVSVKEISTRIPVKVYPNPATEMVNFQTEGADIYELILLDLTGRIIANYPANSNVLSINISNLPKGIYLYHLNGKNKETLNIGKITVK